MTESLEVRTIAQTRVQLIQFMSVLHANSLGNVHGGEIMKLVDEAGALAAMRHARNVAVTVEMDSMTFMEPIHVGNLVTAEAELTYVGTSSMETRVKVTKEHPLTGERKVTNIAYLVYVAIDADGKPTRVPPLMATTPEEEAIMAEGRLRQERRKERRDIERERLDRE
jgi:uncharacterized protein (TIGR00369 family)